MSPGVPVVCFLPADCVWTCRFVWRFLSRYVLHGKQVIYKGEGLNLSEKGARSVADRRKYYWHRPVFIWLQGSEGRRGGGWGVGVGCSSCVIDVFHPLPWSATHCGYCGRRNYGPLCWEPRADKCCLFKARSRSEYSRACFSHCQEFPGPFALILFSTFCTSCWSLCLLR